MGCERRVVYDFVNVIQGEATLNQALIKDKRNENLYILPASQTRDKDALDKDAVGRVIEELKNSFDYIVCDSPAGIESGALMALYYADLAIVVTNPEVSSVRDSDRILGILASRSLRAEKNLQPIRQFMLVTRFCRTRAAKGDMMSVKDIQDILGVPLLGVIPESKAVLRASNEGVPVIVNKESDAGQAYMDAVRRLLGEEIPMRFVDKPTLLERIFGATE
jgi:septum site-determining protein MinD